MQQLRFIGRRRLCSDSSPSPAPTATAPNAQAAKPATAVKEKKKNHTLIGKLTVLAAMVFFLFPLMTVSCNSQKTEITGKDMIIGNKSIITLVESSSSGDHSHLFNIFIFGAAVCAVAAVVIMKQKWLPPLLSFCSTALMVFFRITATSYYKIGGDPLKSYIDNSSEYGLKVRFTFWLYLSILLFGVATFELIRGLFDNKTPKAPKEKKEKKPKKSKDKDLEDIAGQQF